MSTKIFMCVFSGIGIYSNNIDEHVLNFFFFTEIHEVNKHIIYHGDVLFTNFYRNLVFRLMKVT